MRNMETRFKTIDQIINDGEHPDCPIPLEVIPDYMGINLCAVDGISWTRQADGQLVSVTIHFIPSDLARSGAGEIKTSGAPVADPTAGYSFLKASYDDRAVKDEGVEPTPAYDPEAPDPPIAPRRKTLLERLRGAVASAIEDYLDEQQRSRGAS
jgi:hypothetical protein